MKISRRVIQPDGTPKKEDKLVNIAIKPGWKSGTRVTFQKEGDQTHGKIPADIVFIIRDKPHPLYKREGSDIRFTARLTLKQVNSWTRDSSRTIFPICLQLIFSLISPAVLSTMIHSSVQYSLTWRVAWPNMIKLSVHCGCDDSNGRQYV